MNLRRIFAAIVAIACLSLSSCKTPMTIANEYAYKEFDVECLGVSQSGQQTLRTWGAYTDKNQAIENAMRNAVEAVIFKGVTDGSALCDRRPIVNTPNAWEKHVAYFNCFFAPEGAYKKYVVLNEKGTSRIKATSSSMESWSVVVNVDRVGLRQKLAEDGIISKQ